MLGRLAPEGTQFTSGEAVALGFTYFTAGFAVAVLHVTEGTSPVVMIAAVVLANSATSTLAYAAVISGGGSLVAGVLSGWLVATRFGLFAAAIGPRLWPERWKRALSAHLAFDPPVAFAQRESDDEALRKVYLASGLVLVISWWIGGGLGAVLGNKLGDTKALGLDVMLPAMLLAIVWRQFEADRLIGLVGATIALVLVGIAPGGVPVLVAGLAALLALRSESEQA